MPTSPFDLDEVTNLVQHGGISARLSEQEKRLLVLLSARAGTAFDKRALMEALWGTRAQWMEDAALVQLVSRLRRSLAPLGLQRSIVTVARVGYRFDAPTATAHCVSLKDDTPPQVSEPSSTVQRAVPGPRNGASAKGLSVTDAVDTSWHAARLQHGVARDGYGEVHRNGVVVRIPQLEYRLLCALRCPANVVHDKRTLIALLWPARPDQDDTNLMQVVSRLRRKLIPLDLHRHIVTVPRTGYRFEPCDAPAPNTTPASPSLAHRTIAWVAARLPRALSTLTRHLRWREP